MGVSRNSVIGKIHRLGLSGKYRRPREGRPRMRARANFMPVAPGKSGKSEMPQMRTNKRPLAFPAPPLPPLPPPDPPVGAFDLLDLRHGMCRYPSGDRVPFRFCGAPQARDSSYCPEHHALAHNRGSQRDYDRMAEQALAGKLFASRAGVDEAA
jgi:GcrA cell cycle regulator